MKPSRVTESLKCLAEANMPVMLWGAPGVGKSSLVYQLGEEMGRKVYEFRATMIDPVDLRGLMRIVDGRTVWCPPIFLPSEEGGILFIDELPTASNAVQVAFYQLILDRKLGEYTLPDNTIIIAAGNRETDRAAVQRMPTPLANRFAHIEVEFDNRDWEKWLIKNNMPIEMLAWNRFKPSRISAFNPVSTEKAQPTPRSWEFVCRVLQTAKDPSLLYDLVAGIVGKSDAVEFCAFIEDFKLLPDPKKYLADPNTGEIPKKISVLFSLCAALAKLVTTNQSRAFFRFAERLKEEGYTDHAVAMIQDAITRDKSIQETAACNEWRIANGSIYAS